MTTFGFELQNVKNHGDAVEHGICRVFNVERVKHDSISFDKGSDIEARGMRISVKASHSTLMSGSMCKGLDTFDAIWGYYEANTHSDTFIYGTEEGIAYMMDLAEFKRFVYAFGSLERESSKNGGGFKIRVKRESIKMRNWLADMAN